MKLSRHISQDLGNFSRAIQETPEIARIYINFLSEMDSIFGPKSMKDLSQIQESYFLDNVLLFCNFANATYQPPIFVSKGPLRLYLTQTILPLEGEDPWPL